MYKTNISVVLGNNLFCSSDISWSGETEPLLREIYVVGGRAGRGEGEGHSEGCGRGERGVASICHTCADEAP